MQPKMTHTNRVQQQQRLPAVVPVVSCRQSVQCQASRRDIIQSTYGAATLLLAGQVLPALADVELDVQEAQAVAAVADAEVASSSASTSAAVAGGKQVSSSDCITPFYQPHLFPQIAAPLNSLDSSNGTNVSPPLGVFEHLGICAAPPTPANNTVNTSSTTRHDWLFAGRRCT
jgi:hypothetical protein